MNTRTSLFALISLVVLTAACGQKQSGAKLQSAPSGDDLPLSSIGRGAKMTLTKDLEVPANKDAIILNVAQGTFRTDIDEDNVFHKTFTQCGIQMKSASVDRRLFPAGTVIEFSGEAKTHPHDTNGKVNYIDLVIATPSDAQEVTCVSLVAKCWLDWCDPYVQTSFSIRDFKNYMSGTATVDQAPPVIVHSN